MTRREPPAGLAGGSHPECRRPFGAAAAVALVAVVAVAVPGSAVEPTDTTARVSVASDGSEADDASDLVAVSADARLVAFDSRATDLVPGDTNRAVDVFVHDRPTGETRRVSVAADGSQGNGRSEAPALSADGRFVAFASEASNLVPGDTNGAVDVFVHDLATGRTERVSVASGGAQASGAVPPASSTPALSADGRFVAFASNAANLAPGDGNPITDVFVHDRRHGTTELVSVGVGGTPAAGFGSTQPSISADGRFVAFISTAGNLVVGALPHTTRHNVFVRDRLTGRTVQANVAGGAIGASGADFDAHQPALSADGRLVAFTTRAALAPGDTNGTQDVYVRDLVAEVTTLVSVRPDGIPGNGLSGIGAYPRGRPALSADGRFVAFNSLATNLVAGDTNGGADVFVAELAGAGLASVITMRRASVAGDGAEAAPLPDGRGGTVAPQSLAVALSADGAGVAFSSTAQNLVPGDANRSLDVFVRGPQPEGAPAPAAAEPPFVPPTARPPEPAVLGPDASELRLQPGGSAARDYRLELPARPTPLDVTLVVDVSSSMVDAAAQFSRELQRVVDGIAALGVDAHYGVATFHDWSVDEPEGRYARRRDVGPPDVGLAQAVAELAGQAAAGGGNEAHYTALHQAATGAGMAAPRFGAPVPAGRGMSLRAGARRAFLLVADDERINPDPDGPTRFDTVAALQGANVRHLGLNLRRQVVQGVQMEDLSRATGALAPAAGVDCDGDGVVRAEDGDRVEGEPLVCGAEPTGRGGSDLAPPIVALLRALPDEQPVRVVVADDAGLEVAVEPDVVAGVDVAVDHVGDDALPFAVTFTCSQAQAGGVHAVRLAALVGEAEVASATARVQCGDPAGSDAPDDGPSTPPGGPPSGPDPAPVVATAVPSAGPSAAGAVPVPPAPPPSPAVVGQAAPAPAGAAGTAPAPAGSPSPAGAAVDRESAVTHVAPAEEYAFARPRPPATPSPVWPTAGAALLTTAAAVARTRQRHLQRAGVTHSRVRA